MQHSFSLRLGLLPRGAQAKRLLPELEPPVSLSAQDGKSAVCSQIVASIVQNEHVKLILLSVV